MDTTASRALLTATAITREAIRVLHRKLNFVGSITRDYDDSFARHGAKIGDVATVRLPNQYTVRSSGLSEVGEPTTQVPIQTQKGVDAHFTAHDLRLPIDDFSDRYLEPPMAILAALVEGDAMGLYRDVYNQVDNQGQPATFTKVLQGRKILVDNLAPLNGRTCNLNTQDNVDMVDALKGLFNDQTTISQQNREGFMGRTAGFDFMENTLWPRHIAGHSDGWAIARWPDMSGRHVGDVFIIADVFRVHPETKQNTGVLQQFVVTPNGYAPTIVASGPMQNVTAEPARGAAVQFSPSSGISMAYQKGAFVFATADMVMPRGVDFSAREVFDGVSLRLVRQYDINSERFPCRFDLLLGRKTVKPQLAVRLANH